MILINQGETNTVAVTLFEKTTIAEADVHYLFQFTSPDTQTSVYCIPTDTSEFKSRYNLFEIEETDTPDPLAGQVSLKPSGQWAYYVYEQESDTNLDPAGLTLVESGICRVDKEFVGPEAYDSQPKTWTVYNKDNV